MIDYHTHTKLCNHAKGEPRDYVLSAISKNLSEIGLSDHMPLPGDFDPEHRMKIEEFEIYRNWYEKVIEEFGDKIKIRFGVEADFIESEIDFIRNFIKRGDFDYVIGSIHFIDGWNIASHRQSWKWEGQDVNAVYEAYYQTMKKLVSSRLFDVIGHFDMIKKFGYRANDDFEDLIREIFVLIKRNDLCIEINTSGLRHKVAEIYPSLKILELVKEYGIPITLGSDAHDPYDVGRDFDIAYELVDRYADGKISVFDKRERKEIKLR